MSIWSLSKQTSLTVYQGHSITSMQSDSTSSSSSDDETFLKPNYSIEKQKILEYEDIDSECEDFDANEEEIDIGKEFQNIPEFLDATTRLEVLGSVYAFMKPFILLKPQNPALVLDIATIVVDKATRKTLGIVWDVFGPIAAPYYSVLVRTEDYDSISSSSVLFFSLEHSQIVSKDALREDRGVDRDPNEPEEFSDDEAESRKKKGMEEGQV